MPSVLVSRKLKSSRSVAAIGRETAEEPIGDVVGRLLDAGLRPGVVALVLALCARLQAAAQAMEAADDADEAERRDDSPHRTRRDEAKAEVLAILVELRDLLGALHGAGAPAAVGFEGRTPEDPDLLRRLAGTVIASLAKTPLPPPRHPKYALDPKEWIDRLAPPTKTLSQALDDLAAEGRKADKTLSEKNARIAEYDRTFSLTANLLTALLEFAGKGDLADKVRPSTRRAGETEQQEPEPAPDPA